MNTALLLVVAVVVTAVVSVFVTRRLVLHRRGMPAPDWETIPKGNQVSGRPPELHDGEDASYPVVEGPGEPVPAVGWNGANQIAASWRVDGESGPLVEIERSVPAETGRALPQSVIRAISPIVERLPAVGAAGDHIRQQCFKVVFKREVGEGIRNGSFSLMRSGDVPGGFRLNAIDQSGGIVGQGSIVNVGNAVQLGSAAFQAASFITGQAHLAQINARLEAIENKVDEVLRFLQDEQRGRLSASIGYFKEQIAFVLEGPVHQLDAAAMNDCVEKTEIDCRGIRSAAARELGRCADEVKRLRLDRLMNTAVGDHRKLKRATDRCLELFERMVLATEVRVVANEFKAVLLADYDYQLTRSRRRQLQEELRQLSRYLKEIGQQGKKRSSEIKGLFRTRKRLAALRKDIESTIATRTRRIDEQCSLMERTLMSGKSSEDARDQLMDKGVTVELVAGEDGVWSGRMLSS